MTSRLFITVSKTKVWDLRTSKAVFQDSIDKKSRMFSLKTKTEVQAITFDRLSYKSHVLRQLQMDIYSTDVTSSIDLTAQLSKIDSLEKEICSQTSDNTSFYSPIKYIDAKNNTILVQSEDKRYSLII